MQKVLAIGAATARQAPLPAERRVVEFPGTSERTGRTFVCSVLFLEMVEYSRKPIAEQLQCKERFNTEVSQAIADIPAEDRIILDTGDGVAISFLGDPEDALRVALALAPSFGAASAISARIGINLGPVRLTRDINGQPNIIGDGVNVAQRVMSFARPGQVLVSRGYHEVVTRIAEEYAGLFAYQGSRTDKHVREHEIFELVAPLEQANELANRRKHLRRRKAALLASATAKGLLSRRGLSYTVTVGSALLLMAAIALNFQPESPPNPVPGRTALRHTVPAVTPPAVTPGPPVAAPSPAQTAVESPPAPVPVKPTRAAEPKAASAAHSAAKPAPAKPAAGTQPVVAVPTAPESTGPRKAAGLWKPEAMPANPKAAAGPTALVVLAISPWGEVFVDGKSMGVSPPLAELELAPGKHRITVRNGGFKPFQDDVELGSNETVRIKHKFVPR